jgi:hypothetical protein
MEASGTGLIITARVETGPAPQLVFVPYTSIFPGVAEKSKSMNIKLSVGLA